MEESDAYKKQLLNQAISHEKTKIRLIQFFVLLITFHFIAYVAVQFLFKIDFSIVTNKFSMALLILICSLAIACIAWTIKPIMKVGRHKVINKLITIIDEEREFLNWSSKKSEKMERKKKILKEINPAELVSQELY